MKNTLLFVAAMLLPASILIAQIPNPSFEDWTEDNPDYWFSGNTGQFEFVSESTSAHDGAKAAKCNVEKFAGQTFTSPLALGDLGLGVPSATAPEAIHGWFMFNSDGGDVGYGTAGMVNNGVTCGAGAYEFGPSSVYKEFVIDLFYDTGLPYGDSLLLYFIISNPQSQFPHEDSYLIIDDLEFGEPSAVHELNMAPSSIERITPSPSSSAAEITYYLESAGKTQLMVYDVTGRLMQILVDEWQSPGRYKAGVNVSSFTNGIYFCRLSTQSGMQVKRFEVSH